MFSSISASLSSLVILATKAPLGISTPGGGGAPPPPPFCSPQIASSSLKPSDFFQNLGKIPHARSIAFKAFSANPMSALMLSRPPSIFSICSPCLGRDLLHSEFLCFGLAGSNKIKCHWLCLNTWSSKATSVLIPASLASAHKSIIRRVDSRDSSVT